GSSGIFGKSILLQMDPDKVQSFGTVVDIVDGDFSLDGMCIFIQLGGDHIIGAILPIFRPRLAGSCPVSGSLPIGKFIEDILVALVALLPMRCLDSSKKE